MRFLITGATGFIGHHLVERLSRDPRCEIWALVRDPAKAAGLKSPNLHLLKGDLFSIPPLPSEIDCVYHLAGLTKTLKAMNYYTVNQEGTARLFEALEALGSRPRVVLLSSLAAAGPSPKGGMVRESDPPRPIDSYGVSKRKSEEEALDRKDRYCVVIVRPGGVFGPGDLDYLDFFKTVKKGVIPAFGGRRLISHCYVEDLVRALEICSTADIASGEIFHISHPTPFTWEEIGRATARILNLKAVKIPIPLPFLFMAVLISEGFSFLKKTPSAVNIDKFKEMRQPGWVADVSKAADKLGFKTEYSLEEGLRKTLAWYLEKGWL